MWKHLAILACTGMLLLGCTTGGYVRHDTSTQQFKDSALWISTCLERMGYLPTGHAGDENTLEIGLAVQQFHRDYVAEEITGMGRDPTERDVRLMANKLLYAECAKIIGPRDEFIASLKR